MNTYPKLISHYLSWIEKYAEVKGYDREERYQNNIIYHFDNELERTQSIIDYLSGMSDDFIIKAFNELISF